LIKIQQKAADQIQAPNWVPHNHFGQSKAACWVKGNEQEDKNDDLIVLR